MHEFVYYFPDEAVPLISQYRTNGYFVQKSWYFRQISSKHHYFSEYLQISVLVGIIPPLLNPFLNSYKTLHLMLVLNTRLLSGLRY